MTETGAAGCTGTDETREKDALNAEATDGVGQSRRAIRRAVSLLILLLLAVAVVYLSPLRTYLTHLREISDRIRQAGPLAPLIFGLAVAAMVAVGIPRLLLCSIGGMAFGFLPGLVWSQLGTLVGYYLLFLFVRAGGRDFVLRHSSKLHRLAALVRSQGIPAVILARQLPIHGMVVNLLLGLSSMRHRDFLIGTAIGLIPEAVPCALIGSGAVGTSFASSAGFIVLAVCILCVAWIGFGLYARKLSNSGAGG